MKKIFIAWKKSCTRSENIAKHFGAKNIFICPFVSDEKIVKTIARYLISFFNTFFVLVQEKPDIIFTLNQPPFLITAVFLYSKIFRAKYILDSHSAAFNDPKWAWFRPFYSIIASQALFNINTNSYHKSIVESWGGRSFVIGDVPINFIKNYPRCNVSENSVVVVASFMFDEPLEEVWEAARLIPHVNFHVTGNYKKANRKLINNKAENVILTGYISHDDYISLLLSCKAVVALTTRDYTMQMGGYEALSLEMPIVTSDWEILHESFGNGAVYVNNTPDSIALGITAIINDFDKYKFQVIRQRKIRKEYFDSIQAEIINLLNSVKKK